MRRLDAFGTASGWVCLDCGKFLYKPPNVVAGKRFHSEHCRRPMVAAVLSWPQS